jgi:hypothetical protein
MKKSRFRPEISPLEILWVLPAFKGAKRQTLQWLAVEVET